MFEMCAWDVSLRWEWGVVGGEGWGRSGGDKQI